MDWKECNDKGFVKSVKVDRNRVESLIKSSEKKLKSANLLELSDITASTKISIYYESLREILEAISILKGFKIYNHECFCSFLDEVCREKSQSIEFDRFRKIRNRVNYYGEDINVNDASVLAKEITKLRSDLFIKHLKERK